MKSSAIIAKSDKFVKNGDYADLKTKKGVPHSERPLKNFQRKMSDTFEVSDIFSDYLTNNPANCAGSITFNYFISDIFFVSTKFPDCNV